MTRLIEEGIGYTVHRQMPGEVMVIDAGVPHSVICMLVSIVLA